MNSLIKYRLVANASIFVFSCCIAFCNCTYSRAQISTVNKSIEKDVFESPYIGFFHLKEYKLLGEKPSEQLLSLIRKRQFMIRTLHGRLFDYSDVQKPGSYVFSSRIQIQGKLPSELKLSLGFFMPEEYGDEFVTTEKTNNFILLMRDLPNEANKFSPDVQIFPISNKIKFPLTTTFTSPENEITTLLLVSLSDPLVRAVDLKLLSNATGTKIISAAAHYINDPDPKVRDGALSCLISNQQVAAIPRVVKLATLEGTRGQRYYTALAQLSKLSVPEAIPYLNPLLFCFEANVRIYAIDPLSEHSNRSSIPYFVLALRDPKQYGVADSAYYGIRGLAGFARQDWPTSDTELHKNFAHYAAFCNDWWSDELQGKHLTQDEQVVPAEKNEALKTVAGLNTTLFEPYPALRETAIDVLGNKANPSSIPYLVLALQDPDPKVAYGAYKLATRLTGLPTTPFADAAAYASDRDAPNAPVYAWWAEALNGKHPMPHSATLPTAPRKRLPK